MLKKFILKKSEFEEELKNISQIPQIPYMEIETQIKKKNLIGEGGQGTVYAGVYQGKACAIKQVILFGNKGKGKDLFQELQIMVEKKSD